MDYQDINATTIPERYAVTIHMTIPHYEDEGNDPELILCKKR